MTMKAFTLEDAWVQISDGSDKTVQILRGDLAVSRGSEVPTADSVAFMFLSHTPNRWFSFDSTDTVFAKSATQGKKAQIITG